jgi:hypothetical protein
MILLARNEIGMGTSGWREKDMIARIPVPRI